MHASNSDPTNVPVTDPRYLALARRDADADQHFIYAVTTTGIYCRPSCSARTPRPENVRYYLGPEAAERDGYRPCKRCRPRDHSPVQGRARLVEDVCRYIDEQAHVPSLRELAERTGLSESHLQRTFLRCTGSSPAQYAKARRDDRLRRRLNGGDSVTRVAHEIGLGAGGRFHRVARSALGMSARTYRARGKDMRISFAVGQCRLGAILVATTEIGLCAVALGDDPQKLVEELQDDFSEAVFLGADSEFERVVARVVALVDGTDVGIDLALDVRGTAFQIRVWRALQEIPSGETVTYSQLAARLGRPSAARAVASAVAKNPIAIAIPCHRVVRTDGTLGGYRWGLDRKRALLLSEGHPRSRCALRTASRIPPEG